MAFCTAVEVNPVPLNHVASAVDLKYRESTTPSQADSAFVFHVKHIGSPPLSPFRADHSLH